MDPHVVFRKCGSIRVHPLTPNVHEAQTIVFIISSTATHSEPLHDCLSLATIPVFLKSSITPSIHRKFGLPTLLPSSLKSMILLVLSLLPCLCRCPAHRNIAALIVQIISGEIEHYCFLKPVSLTLQFPFEISVTHLMKYNGRILHRKYRDAATHEADSKYLFPRHA